MVFTSLRSPQEGRSSSTILGLSWLDKDWIIQISRLPGWLNTRRCQMTGKLYPGLAWVTVFTALCSARVSLAAEGVKLIDLLALPAKSVDYKVDPYLRVAESLQKMGEVKACKRLQELAARDEWPYTRTVILCRMLFKAKKGAGFRRAEVGGPFLVGGTNITDWPLEPIALVEGIPFLIAEGYILGGEAERPSDYLDYCIEKCDWSVFEFRPVLREKQREALRKLLSSPRLKAGVGDHGRKFLEAQIAGQ
jgi:hypothetical protein